MKQAITFTRQKLIENERGGDDGYLAWLARNLLELRVWVAYCSMSAANAIEFAEDAIRDLADLNRSLVLNHEPTSSSITAAGEALSPGKAVHQYKRVDKAAEECGLADVYKANFKLLSKFAHPTALSVMMASADTCPRCEKNLSQLEALWRMRPCRYLKAR